MTTSTLSFADRRLIFSEFEFRKGFASINAAGRLGIYLLNELVCIQSGSGQQILPATTAQENLLWRPAWNYPHRAKPFRNGGQIQNEDGLIFAVDSRIDVFLFFCFSVFFYFRFLFRKTLPLVETKDELADDNNRL